MKLELITTQAKEILLEGNGISVVVNTWGNLEGANIMVHDSNLAMRMAGAFRWEEFDTICAALTIARSA